MSPQPDLSERPNTIPWPPLLLVAGIAFGALLGTLLPIPVVIPAPLQLAGFVLLAIGITLDISAIIWMARLGTNILPHKAAGALLTSGPFRLSRNPIYLGNTLTLAAMGLAFANLWFAVLAAFMAVLLHRLAILREEAHLAARFGKAWDDYAARTPRWLLF
ncbi:MAG TPA: isoprenylcysteine carboxylmethyltransferase family protein [Xanthobacteraceae bacterium]|nr:isoprenylcysteine carboxylmethyltransferase family protein [Xanthobacteraceae bacterium]